MLPEAASPWVRFLSNNTVFCPFIVFDIVFAATAGAPCRLYITARDRFGNLQFGNSAQHFFYLSQDFTRISFPSVLLSSSLPPLFLDVITSVSGRQRMSILLSSSPGVRVEYFAHSMHWTQPVHSEIAIGIFPRDHYAVVADDQSHLITKYSRLGVRWTGYLRFSSTQLLTFLLTECEETILYASLKHQPRFTLWSNAFQDFR